MGIGERHSRSLHSVFFVLLLFRDWGGGRGIRGVSFFCVFYPYDLPSGPSDPTFTREGRSPELGFSFTEHIGGFRKLVRYFVNLIDISRIKYVFI